MSKYEAVYFVGDNQASNRIRVDSYKTRNRGAFSGSLAALLQSLLATFLKIRFSATFDGHLEFLHKTQKHVDLGNGAR